MECCYLQTTKSSDLLHESVGRCSGIFLPSASRKYNKNATEGMLNLSNPSTIDLKSWIIRRLTKIIIATRDRHLTCSAFRSSPVIRKILSFMSSERKIILFQSTISFNGEMSWRAGKL